MTTNDDSNALARRAASATGIIPRTLDDVARMAKMAHASGLARVASPEAAGVILLTGAELGLSPMQSLRGIYVVDGKPVLSADLMVAVVKRSDVCVYWRTVESTTETCTIETQREREPSPARKTWTRADAERAGLLNRGPWKQYPAQMLRHRCAADLAREVFPDVVLGLYTPDEMDAHEDVAPQPVTVFVETPPTTAQEPPQRPPLTLEGRGIEAPAKTPAAPADVPAQTQPEAPAWRVALDALADEVPSLAPYCNAVEALTLPGDAAPLWRSHRAAIGALSKETKGAAWGVLVARVESLGQGKAAQWITKGVKTLDAAADAPTTTDVQS